MSADHILIAILLATSAVLGLIARRATTGERS